MSENENPVTTVVRLLQKNMHVVKEDGSLANIHVSKEWYDREAFKNYDGQVTVGLEESRDQILEISAKTRRRLSLLRVNVWATDKPEQAINGRIMREKIREEVNRIIRQNRNKPNTTAYDFHGVGQATDTHKAYKASAETELVPQDSGWNELTDEDYAKAWYSDDTRFSGTASSDGECALMLFRFKIESEVQTIKKIVLAFEGYGTAPAGNGFVIKVWNHVAEAWQNVQTSDAVAEDQTVTISLTSNLDNYVDGDGFVWLFARTVNASDGSTDAVLHCDYACCTVTVNGITYCDVISFRDLEDVRVKPFIFRTEFTVKTWMFENVEIS
jgi:hypothetical protein